MNSPANSYEISQLLLRSDVLTEEETAELTRINRSSGASSNKRRRDFLVSILSPYYDQINIKYHFVAERTRAMERVINRIREMRRQERIAELEAQRAAIDEQLKELRAEDDAFFKKLKEDTGKPSAQYEESLDLERKRNNQYAYMQVFVPPPAAPAPPQPLPRYIDSQEHQINQALPPTRRSARSPAGPASGRR